MSDQWNVQSFSLPEVTSMHIVPDKLKDIKLILVITDDHPCAIICVFVILAEPF